VSGPDTLQTVILAGGLGTRLAEETDLRPKPMVEVGDRPMLVHIMDHYASFGCTEFIIAVGYLGHVVKRYFADSVALSGDLEVDFVDGRVRRLKAPEHDWRVRIVETGRDTETAGRLRRVAGLLRPGPFFLTYGDGVGDVDLDALLATHRRQGRLATVTAVHPPARFGEVELVGEQVTAFAEKPQTRQGWINGGFMVLDHAVIDRIRGDADVLERDILTPLAAEGQMSAHRHEGFWRCMDTLRDVRDLQALWAAGQPPWRRIR
jgi:glucose-1-phosphate cytidylyltransferase